VDLGVEWRAAHAAREEHEADDAHDLADDQRAEDAHRQRAAAAAQADPRVGESEKEEPNWRTKIRKSGT